MTVSLGDTWMTIGSERASLMKRLLYLLQRLLYLLQRLGHNPKKQQADATRDARELVHKQSVRSRSCGEGVGERTCSHVHI